jgi:hypothetical protein
LLSTLALKCVLFVLRFGNMYGADSRSFIRTIEHYRMSGILPDLKFSMTSYHPPSSFMIVKTLMSGTGLSSTMAAQILSFASLIGAFLLLRSILKKINVLYSPFGITFLYLFASLPVVLTLTMASTYDSLVFLLAMISLHLSIDLFWKPGKFSMKNSYDKLHIILLFQAFIVALLTKFTGLLFLSFPLVVILVRNDKENMVKNIAIAITVGVLAISSALPYYYARYYKETGDLIPSPMEWLVPKQFSQAKQYRDMDKVGFALNMIRIPAMSYTSFNTARDSFVHAIWHDVWKVDFKPDGVFRKTPNIVVHVLIPIFFIGLLAFVGSHRKRGPPLSDFAWVLTGCTAVFILANLYFAYQNPFFGDTFRGWRVFKAKYSPPTILWIAFICSLGITNVAGKLNKYTFGKLGSISIVSLLFLMTVINHTAGP